MPDVSTNPHQMQYLENHKLSDYSTIRVGGIARYFCKISSIDELRSSLNFASSQNLKWRIIGEGSNLLISDSKYDGLIIKNESKGIQKISEDDEHVIVECNSGNNWDDFVLYCLNNGYAGLECLSGIPGSVGATPVQNVGAYGQEVSQTIVEVVTLDTSNDNIQTFTNSNCNFRYRYSIFKQKNNEKYIIIKVRFTLTKNSPSNPNYKELIDHIYKRNQDFSGLNQKEKLQAIRNSVLYLRRMKSMLIDKNDPNSISLGSFFTNPVINEIEYQRFKLTNHSNMSVCPIYKTDSGYKVSAAWLIENAGFKKGYIYKNTGLSQNHTLAIINRNNTTCNEILEFSKLIQEAVYNKYGIHLLQEPTLL